MSEHAADDWSATFGRPFLGASAAPAVPAAAAPAPDRQAEAHRWAEAEAEAEVEEDSFIRPYFLTGGRVHQASGAAGFETIYVRTPEAGRPGQVLRTPEEEAILARCSEPLSVAELSAHLRLPIGVVLVLTEDLAASGALSTRTAASDVRHDLSIITRLIHAVHAL